MEVRLIRLATKDSPQKGVLLFNGEPLLVTLELPWKENKADVSCIPCGKYNCIRIANRTTKGGMHLEFTYVVSNVGGRSGILFHPGNSIVDSTGCVLVAERFGDNYEVRDSVVGFKRFLNYLEGADFFPLCIKALLW